MSRVLFLVNHDIVIYNFRLELVEELLKQKHEVIISCPYGERIDDLVRIGAIHKNISIDRHGINPIKDFLLIKNYIKLIREIKPDVVFSYTIKPNIYGAIAARKCNVNCIANITGLGTAIENGGIKRKICIMMYRYALKNVKKVFFQNKSNLNFFLNHKIIFNNYDLLPGSGVNLERYNYYELTSSNIFLFIGRIMRDKGINEFLKAAKKIKTTYPEAMFYVCGFCDDKNYECLIKKYAAEGVIEYFGMVRNPLKYYQEATCVVLPSYHEGMSNTLLGAASCGRPLIATNVPGCEEVIDDGINGYLVKQCDDNDLYEKMISFYKLSLDEKRKMGINGRIKMEKEFDRSIVVKKYIYEIN